MRLPAGFTAAPGPSLTRVYLEAALTLAMAGFGSVDPGRRYFFLMFFLLGMSATWRDYAAWRRTR